MALEVIITILLLINDDRWVSDGCSLVHSGMVKAEAADRTLRKRPSQSPAS